MYKIFEFNPQLKPYTYDIANRMHRYKVTKWRILNNKITLNDFANAHDYYGIHHTDDGWVYREWAPSAYQLYLTGDFNNWNWTEYPMKNLGNGSWELHLPEDKLWDGCKVKTIVDANFTRTEHIPLYAKRVSQDPKTHIWAAEVVDNKNNLDQLIAGIEKVLRESGDKISAEDKSTLESAVEKAKETHKTADNAETLKTAIDELTKVSNDIFTKLYQNANPNAGAGEGQTGSDQNAGTDPNNFNDFTTK